MSAEFNEHLQVPPEAPSCVKPIDVPHGLMDEYYKAKEAPGTRVETGNLTEKLTLPDGTVYRSDYTLEDMTITNLNTHQADKFVGLYRTESNFFTTDADGNIVHAIAAIDREQVTQERGVRGKDGKVLSYFNDEFKPDGNASRAQCADPQGRINYDKTF